MADKATQAGHNSQFSSEGRMSFDNKETAAEERRCRFGHDEVKPGHSRGRDDTAATKAGIQRQCDTKEGTKLNETTNGSPDSMSWRPRPIKTTRSTDTGKSSEEIDRTSDITGVSNNKKTQNASITTGRLQSNTNIENDLSTGSTDRRQVNDEPNSRNSEVETNERTGLAHTSHPTKAGLQSQFTNARSYDPLPRR